MLPDFFRRFICGSHLAFNICELLEWNSTDIDFWVYRRIFTAAVLWDHGNFSRDFYRSDLPSLVFWAE